MFVKEKNQDSDAFTRLEIISEGSAFTASSTCKEVFKEHYIHSINKMNSINTLNYVFH
jgi:hypothetical protein